MAKPVRPIAAMLILGLHLGAAATTCPVAANLTAIKASYMANEPIEVRLTVNNTGQETAHFLADYPYFGEGIDSGIRFTIHGERPPFRLLQPAGSWPASHLVPIQPLAPGETFSVSIVLQSFMYDLPP